MLVIETSNRWRKFRSYADLPAKYHSQFDWLSDRHDSRFIEFQNSWYHLSQFMRAGYPGTELIAGYWQASYSTSATTGLLIKVFEDEYKIATFREVTDGA